MSTEPWWLSVDDVQDINPAAVTVAGAPCTVLNAGALDSPVSRSRNRFLYEGEDDVLVLACVLLIAVGRAHAFLLRTSF